MQIRVCTTVGGLVLWFGATVGSCCRMPSCGSGGGVCTRSIFGHGISYSNGRGGPVRCKEGSVVIDNAVL